MLTTSVIKQPTWEILKPYVDQQSFERTANLLKVRLDEATWWRNASIAYFQNVSGLELPKSVGTTAITGVLQAAVFSLRTWYLTMSLSLATMSLFPALQRQGIKCTRDLMRQNLICCCCADSSVFSCLGYDQPYALYNFPL